MTTYENLFASLPRLVRRLGRAIDIGRGVSLTADEVNLLILTGAYETLQAANLSHLKERASARLAGNEQKS